MKFSTTKNIISNIFTVELSRVVFSTKVGKDNTKKDKRRKLFDNLDSAKDKDPEVFYPH